MSENKQIAVKDNTVNGLLCYQGSVYRQKFEEVLGKKAPAFISSVISATSMSNSLSKCDPKSVLSAAMIAATLDLPITTSLGFAALVPYSGKAQFQIMRNGLVQLAIRSGQYKTINACEVYDGELVSENRITGEYFFDHSKKKSDKVIGYVAYLKLITGFEKYLYMTVKEVTAHAKKHSKSFSSPDGRWQLDFDAMALKTVLKRLLSKYGPLSVEMQQAIELDQAVIDGEGKEYVDNNGVVDLADDAPMPEPIKPAIEAEAKPEIGNRLQVFIINSSMTKNGKYSIATDKGEFLTDDEITNTIALEYLKKKKQCLLIVDGKNIKEITSI